MYEPPNRALQPSTYDCGRDVAVEYLTMFPWRVTWSRERSTTLRAHECSGGCQRRILCIYIYIYIYIYMHVCLYVFECMCARAALL